MMKYPEDAVREWQRLYETGLSLSEVAVATGVPRPTIAWRLARIGTKLRTGARKKRTEPRTVYMRDYRRAWHLEKTYGLTVEQFDALVLTQSGRCAICLKVPAPTATGYRGKSHKRDPNMGVLRVDHDHATGKVRGLLCHGCNVALGHFKSDLGLLDNAKKYLIEHFV